MRSRKEFQKVIIPLVGLFLLVVALPLIPNSFAANPQELIEGAKKEGELVLYASMNLEEANIIINKFAEKYPFLKVNLNRTGSEKLLSKVLTEARAKKNFADVIQTVEFSMHTLTKRKILGRYLPAGNSLYPNEFKEEGYWTTAYYNPYVVAYNTKLVPQERLPKTYEDLLNPVWKGKMMMEGTKVDWFAGMLQIMGRERGLKFMRELAKQQLMLRTGHNLIAQLVAAGEAHFDINIPASSIDRMKETGAPIDWTALGPAPAIMVGIGIAAQPPHPNAARLYVDFVLSKEGQRLMRGFTRLVARSDFAQEQAAATKGMKIVPVNPDLADRIDEYTKLLRDTFSK
ncbi:MAG: ABC transporter substrate-binding protein [Candidatus Binatia bacterium]